MPTILAANESAVLLDGKPVEGVRSIEYRQQQTRENVYGLGSAERIGITSGALVVEGRLRVASASPALAAIPSDKPFQISALLKHGSTTMTVSFDECYVTEKSFAMAVSSFGESIYSFTATRVREEVA